MAFDWNKSEAEARALNDKDLVERAQESASAFVVLWREGESRARRGDFRLSVNILQDRIGIIVEGYRIKPV